MDDKNGDDASVVTVDDGVVVVRLKARRSIARTVEWFAF